MSQFGFLLPEWPDVHAAAARAEALALADPRAAAFYTRRSLELAVAWLYRFDRRLTRPYQDTLAALVHEPTFRAATGNAVFFKARLLKDIGNAAVHSDGDFAPAQARGAVKELFHIAFWLVRSYARGAKPADTLQFDPTKLPPPMAQIAKLTVTQLRKTEAELRERDAALLAKDAQLQAAATDRAALEANLRQAWDEIERIRAANAAKADTHDYGEADTRDHFVDKYLREAGWDPDAPGTTEVAGFRDARPLRQRLRRLCAVGRRRPPAGAGGGQAQPRLRHEGPAAGQALCRLPGSPIRPAPGDLRLQRL